MNPLTPEGRLARTDPAAKERLQQQYYADSLKVETREQLNALLRKYPNLVINLGGKGDIEQESQYAGTFELVGKPVIVHLCGETNEGTLQRIDGEYCINNRGFYPVDVTHHWDKWELQSGTIHALPTKPFVGSGI